jgi:hypothetical protein
MILRAVEAIGGWHTLCSSENGIADRARFIEAYNLLLKKETEKMQQMPAVSKAQEELAQGKERVETAVSGLLAGMNGTGGKQETDNGYQQTENGQLM